MLELSISSFSRWHRYQDLTPLLHFNSLKSQRINLCWYCAVKSFTVDPWVCPKQILQLVITETMALLITSNLALTIVSYCFATIELLK